MTWTGPDVKIALGGVQVLSARLPEPLGTQHGNLPCWVPPMARGLDIEDNRRRIKAPMVTFGPAAGVLLDDLVMSR